MRVILFDIDGTLIHTNGAGRDALNVALSREFGVTDPHPVDLSGRTDRGICRELFEIHGIPQTEENWDRFRHAYLEALDEHLHQRQGMVLPGVNDLVGSLKQQANVALGLLTGNIREGARRKLARYGLAGHFAFGGFGDDHCERDDIAREALAASRRHCGDHVCADDIWVIGDTPLDVRCARSIGARVIAVATGFATVEALAACEPDLLAPSLADTRALVQLLTA